MFKTQRHHQTLIYSTAAAFSFIFSKCKAYPFGLWSGNRDLRIFNFFALGCFHGKLCIHKPFLSFFIFIVILAEGKLVLELGRLFKFFSFPFFEAMYNLAFLFLSFTSGLHYEVTPLYLHE